MKESPLKQLVEEAFSHDYKATAIEGGVFAFIFRWAQRLAIAGFGIGIIWLTLELLLPRLFGNVPIYLALFISWLLFAYLILPALWRVLLRLFPRKTVPHLTTTADGILGDPVNLALRGSKTQVETAMTAAGWYGADSINPKSIWKMVTTSALKRSYKTAPFSALYLHGRKHQLAFQQQVNNNPRTRHHVRFWKFTELEDEDSNNLWIGAATNELGLTINKYTGKLTHKIDPDTDTERQFVINSLREANKLVNVHEFPSTGEPYKGINGEGDRFYADGKLLVGELK